MLVKFKKQYTHYLENNKEFNFEVGYWYQCKLISSLYCVTSIDGKIEIVLNEEQQKKYLE